MLDRASICVRAGQGGNGSVSFRREKYVPKGGPDGGDGAPGGDVVLVATRQLQDLSHFRHRHHFKAPAGGHGRGGGRRGAEGAALEVEVPVGTEVRDEQGALLADLAHEGARVLVARGGEGGRGNICFKSSRRQAPRFAEKGLPGEERWLTLTLKLLADIGLVGLPNAGKSSLLAALTRARPRVAAYPFTTLEPNLGVLELDEGRAVIADIPGLIDGASSGAGLGHRFLAHVERTSVLVYVVDGSAGAAAALDAVETVRRELEAFAAVLTERPAVIAVNKADLMDGTARDEVARTLRALAWPRAVVAVSATSGEDLEALVAELEVLVAATRRDAAAGRAVADVTAAAVLHPGAERLEAFTVSREAAGFRVHGIALERLVGKADIDNPEALAYLQEVIERAGLNAALRRAGAEPGDTVLVGEREFEFA
ncbi:MAG: GTPase ObgE [Thermoleophilia bacterium]|jgi:GTP-binding protein|nr:GTPase ObgE [Thermoleophilia bacterium]